LRYKTSCPICRDNPYCASKETEPEQESDDSEEESEDSEDSQANLEFDYEEFISIFSGIPFGIIKETLKTVNLVYGYLRDDSNSLLDAVWLHPQRKIITTILLKSVI
jgi:hypothetical protein